jgi:hypothetical protein
MSEKKLLDFTGDEYWGKGGRYVVNPATGKREPAPVVEEDVAATPAAGPESQPGQPAAKGSEGRLARIWPAKKEPDPA